MDRHDERRSVNESDEESSSVESTDILGLSGAPVPKMPGDPSASNDPESVRRRRERARESEDSMDRRDEGDRHSGTGIDIRPTGQRTDL
jgi:hypothetical protein